VSPIAIDLSSLPLTTEALSVHIASCQETCRSRTLVFKLISLVLAVSRFTMLESFVICYCTSTACGLIKPILHTHLCRYRPTQSNPLSGSAKLWWRRNDFRFVIGISWEQDSLTLGWENRKKINTLL